jgi:hypothetical protein
MTKLLARCLIPAAMLGAACDPATALEEDDGTCQQTYEFGNYGCARIVVMVQGPAQPWPASYRWDVRAVPTRDGSGADVAFSVHPDTGAVLLQLIRWSLPAPGSGDTASVWVAARLLDDPRPIQPGVPLPVFAADSVLHVARFAPVGWRPPVDTVWLTLQRR